MLECPCLAITVSTMSSSPRPSSSMMPCSSHRPPWSLKVSTSKTRMPFLNFVSLAGHHSQQYEATFPALVTSSPPARPGCPSSTCCSRWRSPGSRGGGRPKEQP